MVPESGADASSLPLELHIDVENVELSPLRNHESFLLSPPMDDEITVASAVASEKARLRQQSVVLDKWVSSNGNNLYPSRDEKERLASQMNMTYAQVNRWFANRRRKQTKRTKIVNSPASFTTQNAQENAPRVPTPSGNKEVINAFMHAFAARPGNSSEEKEMVVQRNSENPLTPPAEDAHHAYNPQVVPEVSPFAGDPAALQKLLAMQLQYNPTLLAMMQPYAAQLQLIQQAQALQAQHHLAQQQQLAAQLAAAQQQSWMTGGSSISASPAHISDSEVSELSELSPRPASPVRRPHSPMFKDGHKLADPSIVALMNLSNLSEKEQLAVNILMEMSTEIR